ncbi:ATP phosphoribosyltransferase [Candidatus Roizmanbacteria bacterium]|nr:ATP phosphoribosyltransferase [Candidatus Roizmanbacteria bacterium]
MTTTHDHFHIGLPKGTISYKSYTLIRSFLNKDVHKTRLHYFDKRTNIHFYLLKQRDIPKLVHDGTIDIGITSTEWIREKGYPALIVKDVGWCNTRLSLLAHKTTPFPNNHQSFSCVTEFPTIARDFFASKGYTNISIEQISGSTEGLVPYVYSCAIDCVETGKTIQRHELVEKDVIFISRTVVIVKNEMKKKELERILQLLLNKV